MRNTYLLAYSLAILFMVACAKIGSLSGGKKDVIPPRLVNSEPELFAKNFHGKKIQLDFDEFITLNDVNKQLVISPPLQKQPEIVQRNKSIYINMSDKEILKPNTTYTLYFGNAVKDLNEGNVYKNFEFVFSTGPIIDSLSIRGKISNAFDLKPDKDGFYIMLYDHFEDSVPRKNLPEYVTKSDDRGWFTLAHMRDGNYMLFALKDQNQNYKFDILNEQIAFNDSLIHLNNSFFIPEDSLRIDTTKMDSVKKAKFVFDPKVELFSFEEDYKNQKLVKYERNFNQFTLIFDRPESDTIPLKPLNFDSKSWFIADKKVFSDTLNFWIIDTALVRKDTLRLAVNYLKKDSVGKSVLHVDTIALITKQKFGSKSKKQKVVNNFKIESGVSSGEVDLNRHMFLKTSEPIKSFDAEMIHLYLKDEDKEKEPQTINFKMIKDSFQLRTIKVDFAIEPNRSYSFIADSGAFLSLYNEVSDSTGIEFTTQKDDYYGTIKLAVRNVTSPLLVQVLTESNGVVKEKYLDNDGQLFFNFLYPGKYRIKAIYDTNRNKKWDTGNFKQRLQPEKVKFYDKTLDIRSNWEIDESWDL